MKQKKIPIAQETSKKTSLALLFVAIIPAAGNSGDSAAVSAVVAIAGAVMGSLPLSLSSCGG